MSWTFFIYERGLWKLTCNSTVWGKSRDPGVFSYYVFTILSLEGLVPTLSGSLTLDKTVFFRFTPPRTPSVCSTGLGYEI